MAKLLHSQIGELISGQILLPFDLRHREPLHIIKDDRVFRVEDAERIQSPQFGIAPDSSHSVPQSWSVH